MRWTIVDANISDNKSQFTDLSVSCADGLSRDYLYMSIEIALGNRGIALDALVRLVSPNFGL